MQPIDEKLERLMARSLDGEITDDEALALNKALLRHPEARERMEHYRRDDALAADALRAALGASDARTDAPLRETRQSPSTFKRPRWAMAASLLLLIGAGVWMIGNPLSQGPTTEDNLIADSNTNRTGEIPLRPAADMDARSFRYVPEGPHRRQRRSDRDILVIPDEQPDRPDEQPDRFYLLERNRKRSMVIPAGLDM
jgi:hypothetical protein